MSTKGILAAIVLLLVKNIDAFCTNVCGGTISVSSGGNIDINYPCPPNNYPNNLRCLYDVKSNGNITQVILSGMDVEPWHDFLKLDGPDNFLLFVNSTTHELTITGYPASDLNMLFYTDADITFSGINVTIYTLPESILLEQYNGYQKEGAVQLLKSPLYISSNDDKSTNSNLDVMFLNLPNDTLIPGDAWIQYARLVSQSSVIKFYDITATGFSANWTKIEGALYYDVTITEFDGIVVLRSTRVYENEMVYSGLPSGTELNVTVEAINKLYAKGKQYGNVTTGFAAPFNVSANNIKQNNFDINWTAVNGAITYLVNVTGENFTNSSSNGRTTYNVGGLSPGIEYTIVVRAGYQTGISKPVTIHQITVPNSLSNLMVVNITTSSVVPVWKNVRGAEYVDFFVTKNTLIVAKANIKQKEMGKAIEGLEPATSYQLHAQTGNEAGLSPSVVTNFTSKLISDSVKFTVDNITNTSFIVRWPTILGSIYYEVSVVDTGQLYSNKTRTDLTQLTWNNLPSGSNFDIKLYVFSTPTISKVLQTQASTDVSPLVGLAIYSVTQTSFIIEWTPIFGAISYFINASSASVSNTFQNTTSALLINNLESGTEYFVSVVANFSVGFGSANTVNQITVPGNVTDLGVGNIGTHSFTPTWQQVSGASSYELAVYRKREGSVVTSDNPVVSGIQVNNIFPGTIYLMRVKAVNQAGKSAETTFEFTTALSDPTQVKIVSVTKNRFLFTWEEVEEAILYHYSCSNKPDVFMITDTSVEVTGLDSNTQYSCYVYAQSGDDVFSERVSADATTAQRECEKDPCLNFGTCLDMESGFECLCTPGFEGITCEKPIDWCKSKICASNAVCTNERLQGVCSCNEGYLGDPELRCRAYCIRASVTVEGEILTFNFTYSGGTAYSNENCNGGRSKASAVCNSRVEGGKTISEFRVADITLVKCDLEVADVTIKVNATSKKVSAKELETQSAQLQVLTSAAEDLTNDEVEKVADYIHDVGALAEKNKESVTQLVLIGIVNTADNLISSNSISLEETNLEPVTSVPGIPPLTTEPPISAEKRENELKQNILKSLTTIAEQVQIPNDTKEIVIETKSMVVKVFEVPITKQSEDSDEPALTSTWFAPVITENLNSDSSDDRSSSEMYQPMNISIPFSALEKADDRKGRASYAKALRLTFFLHKDDSLFPSNSSAKMIIAASLGSNLNITNLPDPITIGYNDLSSKQGITNDNMSSSFYNKLTAFKCVYWDFASSSWETDGCCLRVDETDHATCECDHLTNYALLVSKSDIPADVALEIASDIGCYLSIAGLLCTIIVHCLKEEIRKRRPTQLLLQICCSLLASYIVFVFGITLTENKISCIAIAAVLQFLFLSSWCWMTVYASDMYRSLVLVFHTGNSRYMTKCALFAYGVPLLITIINLTVSVIHVDNNNSPSTICHNEDHENHASEALPLESSYVANNMCWLHNSSLYFGFLLPVGLMLIFNLFVYAMVMRTLLNRGKKIQSSAKQTTAKDNLLISITLSASTGMTWIVGYLMLLSDEETYLLVTSWIFSILNTLQGLIIFLTTCVRHENMRKIWWTPLCQTLFRACERIHFLSPNRKEFNLSNMSELNSTSLSSKSTQNTKALNSTMIASYTTKDQEAVTKL